MNNFDYIHELLIKILMPVSNFDCEKTFILAFETLKLMSQNYRLGYTELCFDCNYEETQKKLGIRQIKINSKLINLNFVAQEKSQNLKYFLSKYYLNYNNINTLLILSRHISFIDNVDKNGNLKKPFLQIFSRKEVEKAIKLNQVAYLEIQSKLEKIDKTEN